MPDTKDQVRDRIETFVDDLRGLIRKQVIDEVRSTLEAQGFDVAVRDVKTPPASPPPVEREHESFAPGPEMPPEALPRIQAQLYRLVLSEPGLRMDQIIGRVRAAPARVKYAMQALRKRGLVTGRGATRGKRYYPIRRAA